MSIETEASIEKDFSDLLRRSHGGDRLAQGTLINLILGDLRRLARRHRRSSRMSTTLNTTALVHESYMRLVSPAAQHVETRAHFMNLASRIMRQIICDYARRRTKHDGVFAKNPMAVELGHVDAAEIAQADQLVKIDEALNELEKIEARLARVVECRFFAGLTAEETAVALNSSVRTVQRDWARARDWLAEHLELV